MFCTGGINPQDPYNPLDNKDHYGMIFLRDKLGALLSRAWIKSLVLIIFTSYIVVAIWGITNIKEGLDTRNTVNFDSYLVPFYNMDDKYFNEYRYPINVMITGENIDYADKGIQAKMEEITQTFENSTYISGAMTNSWLRDFLGFIDRNRGWYSDVDINIDTEETFVTTLQNSYLSDPNSAFNLDVIFDESGKRIVASRFLVLGLFINDSVKEAQMVRELRSICQQFSSDEFQVNYL